jgi:membrane protein required for colicin V production
MSGFDILLIAIVLLSAIAAAAHGFFSEVFSLVGTIAGFLLASWQYWRIAPWFEPYVKSPAFASAAGFLAILIAVIILGAIAGKVSSWIIKEAGLRWVDRFLGGTFGVVRGLVFATILVLVATAFTPEAGWLQRSTLAGYLTVSARVVAWSAPAALRAKFLDGVAYLRKARQEALAKVDKSPAAQRHD